MDGAHSKFRRLIEGRQTVGQKTEVTSLEHLKRKVMNFIDDNQDLEQMISESEESTHMESHDTVQTMENLSCLTVDGCISLLKTWAAQGSCALDVLAGEVLAKRIIHLSGSDSNGSENECPAGRMLTENQKASLLCITKTIKSLLSEQSFNRVHFAKCLSSKGHQLCLEVLYILHKECIISFNTFLAYSIQHEESVGILARSFLSLCFSADNETKKQRELILSVLLGAVLSLAYPDHKTSKKDDTMLAQTSQGILTKIVKGCEDCSASGTGKSAKKSIQVLEVIRTLTTVPHSLVCKFFTNYFNRTLCPPAVSSTSGLESAVEAFCNQNKWKFASLSDDTRHKYSQFLLVFEADTIMDALKHALNGQQVEWQVVLSFLSVFLVCVKEAARLIEDYVSEVVSDALIACDTRLLTVAFLVIRQASREGGHVFQSYITWFQKTFGDSTRSGLNSKRNVQFFLKFLTDLVPYELAEYLKVHIIKSPAVPSKLRSFLTDYISLAKTRLMDLKEPLELMPLHAGESSGLGEGTKSQHEKQLQHAANDVEKSLEAYEKSGKVPSSVMEASIFRKPYFVGRFLPALLIPRKVPDVPDATSQFIQTLTRAGKIPNSLIKAYKTACEKVEKEDLEANSSDDEHGQLSMMGKLQKRLVRMTVVVLDSLEGKPGVTSLLSLICSDIKTLLDTKDEAMSFVQRVELDLYSPNLEKNVIQVSDVVLNAFCRTCAAVRCRTAASSPGKQDSYRWADSFIAMVTSIPDIAAGVCFRLWTLICTQGLTLKEHHLCGLTAFLCHLGASQTAGSWCTIGIRQLSEHFTRTQSNPANTNRENLTFLDSLCDHIPLGTREWMEFAIRFYCSFAQHALLNFVDVSVDSHQASSENICHIPQVLIRKLGYLLDRLNHNGNSRGENHFLPTATLHLAQLITSSPIFKKLKEKAAQVTLAEWCLLELNVNSKEDFLSVTERQRYHKFTLLNRFLPLPSPDGGCDGSPRTACSVLMDSSLDFDNSINDTYRIPHNTLHRSNSFEGGRQDMIILLQELLPILSVKDRGETGSRDIWLITRFHSRMEKVSDTGSTDRFISCDAQQRSETISFMRVALLLPPYLLFCDKPTSSPDAASIQNVVSLINTRLRPILGELCCLPFDVTLYLLKAVLTCGGTDSPERSSLNACSTALSVLLKDCPVFFVSLQHYWKQLKPVAASLCGHSDALPEQLLQVDHVFNGLHRRHLTEEPVRNEGMPLRELNDVSAFLVAPCMFLTVTSQRDIKVLLEAKDCCQSFFSEVAVCVFDCFMAQYAAMMLEGREIMVKDILHESAVVLLQALPKVLLVFSDEEGHEFNDCLQQLRTQVLNEDLRKIYPVVYFSFLMKVPRHILQQVMKFEGFLRITLRIHSEFVSLRGCALGGPSLRNVPIKPFHLDFCHQVFTFVRDRVHSFPMEILRNLPQNIIATCQPELRQVLSRRLQT